MRRIRSLAVVGLSVLAALPAGCNRQDPADEAFASGRLDIGNFREHTDFTRFFRPEKDAYAQYASTDEQGLRIAVPQGTTTEPVGIVLKRSLRGDFDISVNYQLLKAEAGDSWGSGFQVLFKLDTPGHDTVFVARQARGDGQSIVFQHMTDGPDGRRVSKKSKVVDVDAVLDAARPPAKIGFARQGSRLTATYRLGSESQQALGVFEIGADPVLLVRLAANPERAKYPVDVRVLDFTLRADDMSEAASGGHRGLLTTAVVVAAVLLAGLALWAVRRRLAARVKTAS
jgi:hypothetical protein